MALQCIAKLSARNDAIRTALPELFVYRRLDIGSDGFKVSPSGDRAAREQLERSTFMPRASA